MVLRSVCETIIHVISKKKKIKKISVTVLGIWAALETDAHQSIEAQKGNPPSQAHHHHPHHHPFCWEL